MSAAKFAARGDFNAPLTPDVVRRPDPAVFGHRLGPERAPQYHPVRPGRPARPDRHAADRARNGRDPRQGRQFQEFALAVSDLHHRQCVGDGDRPLPRRYRRFQQHHLYRLSRWRRGRHRHAVPRSRPGAARCRRAFRRRLSQRGNRAENGARQGLQHGRHRQARPDPDFRSYRQDRHRWLAFDRDRRLHRRQERRSAFGRNESGADQGQSGAGDAVAWRERQGRRFQDGGHRGAEHRAAGLFRRRRRQDRAADVQGAQQAVRAGVLVARPRWQPAQ